MYQDFYLRMPLENPRSLAQNFVGEFEHCRDTPYVFCDDLSNINYEVMYPMVKGLAAATIQLANDLNLRGPTLNFQPIISKDRDDKAKHEDDDSFNENPNGDNLKNVLLNIDGQDSSEKHDSE